MLSTAIVIDDISVDKDKQDEPDENDVDKMRKRISPARLPVRCALVVRPMPQLYQLTTKPVYTIIIYN